MTSELSSLRWRIREVNLPTWGVPTPVLGNLIVEHTLGRLFGKAAVHQFLDDGVLQQIKRPARHPVPVAAIPEGAIEHHIQRGLGELLKVGNLAIPGAVAVLLRARHLPGFSLGRGIGHGNGLSLQPATNTATPPVRDESDFSRFESTISMCESNDRKCIQVAGTLNQLSGKVSMQTAFEVTKTSRCESNISNSESDDRKLFQVAGKLRQRVGNRFQCRGRLRWGQGSGRTWIVLGGLWLQQREAFFCSNPATSNGAGIGKMEFSNKNPVFCIKCIEL
jgi:hypothetical protein